MIGHIRAWLHQQFPSALSRQETFLRLRVIAFFATPFFAIPIFFYFDLTLKSVFAIVALWLQLGSAGLLWREANSGREEIELLVVEFRRAPPTPKSTAEKLIWWSGSILSWLTWVWGYLLVASTIWLRGNPHDLRPTWIAEIKWLGIMAGLTLVIEGSSRYSSWKFARLRKALMAPQSDPVTLVRQTLRTVAFALFAVATVLQAYPAWDPRQGVPNVHPVD
jgi:hypothetical protein